MSAPSSGSDNHEWVEPASPGAGSGIRGLADLDPLDRVAFDLAISEEIERADAEADPVVLADRAMARLRHWKAERAGQAVLALLDRSRTITTLRARATQPHPDRHLVLACERLLREGAAAATALPEQIAALHARTALGRRAKAEAALALIEDSDEPAAILVRSVILDSLAGLPADRA